MNNKPKSKEIQSIYENSPKKKRMFNIFTDTKNKRTVDPPLLVSHNQANKRQQTGTTLLHTIWREDKEY